MVEPILRDALIFASLLTLLSSGLTLTYMTTKVPNFAHGSIATIGFYVSLVAGRLWGISPYYSTPLGFSLGAGAAVLLYVGVLGPLTRKGANLVVLMVATLAYDLLLLGAFNILADYLSRSYGVASRYFVLSDLDFVLLGQPGLFIAVPSITLFTIVLLHIGLTKTKFGIAMRAVVENPHLSGVLGINLGLIYTVSWILAGGLAGLSGSLMALWLLGNPDAGPSILPSIFAASIAGGFLNIYGAALGGYAVGIAEVLGTSYLSGLVGAWIIPYRPIIPLTIIAVTLLISPQGLTAVDFSFLREKSRRSQIATRA